MLIKKMCILTRKSTVSVGHLTHIWGMVQQYQGWVDADVSESPSQYFDQTLVLSRLALCTVWFCFRSLLNHFQLTAYV